MKNRALIALVAGVGLFAAAAISQTSVYSANAVGFIKVDFPKGQWTMCSVPLNSMTGSASAPLSEILGNTNLPVGTKAYFWKSNQTWDFETVSEIEDPDTGELIPQWTPGTATFSVGQGLFVNVPDTAPSNTYTVFMTGEVPAGATSTVYQVEGFTLFGYPYPVDAGFASSKFTENASVGDKCYVWSGGSWVPSTCSEVEDPDTGELFKQWIPEVTFAPGSAVFYQAISSVTNPVVRPYTYPAE